MEFLFCVCYYALMGVLSFVAGRLIARHNFDYSAPPFRALPFEQDGQIYKRVGVASWQAKVPDMSRVFKKLMPPKKMDSRPDKETLLLMIQETCVAELVHALLCVFGIAAFWIWPGWGGVIAWLLYCLLGNLPFIIIQRYNRPRLIKLLWLCQMREERKK